MRIRCDGEQTRRRIVEAASRIFSEKGFRDATHQMICGEAGANRAAINHHFGDKKSLYRAVWQHLLDTADRDNPVSGDLPSDRPPTERFETHIRALLNRHFGAGISGQLERLRILERVNPTGLVDDILAAHHKTNRQEMLVVLDQLLGPAASGPAIVFYETIVLALCRGEWFGSDSSRRRLATAKEIELLAKQLACFVLAGIENQVHLKTTTSQSKNRGLP